MSLPSFLGRAHDAAGPLLGGIEESEFGERLGQTSVTLEIGAELAADPGHRGGFLTAANLAARLYPRLHFDAPGELREQAVRLASSINPGCAFGPPRGRALSLSWGGGEPAAERVVAWTEGWNLAIDSGRPAPGAALAPVAIVAAGLGVGELFRAAFAEFLPHGRADPAPFELNLLTLAEPVEAPPLPERIELGEVHLAGCGAIGQAAVAVLRELPVHGTLVAVDHDRLDTGNLQRYLLSRASDVGEQKSALIEQALAKHPLRVEPVATRWGADQRSAPRRRTVLSALDTKPARVELQAGLPFELFNAWTQERDIGVSRHQAFGSELCLACLAWPKNQHPSESRLIADALGEHELRVIIHLGHHVPAGAPLPAAMIAPTGRLPLPQSAQAWGERSLLEDLIERFELPAEKFEPFAAAQLGELYRDAVCGSMLLRLSGAPRSAELAVPLAHQSALAGALLATWLVIDRVPQLRELRNPATQARYDVLRAGEQAWARDWGREQRCLCRDPDFQDAYRNGWTP